MLDTNIDIMTLPAYVAFARVSTLMTPTDLRGYEILHIHLKNGEKTAFNVLMEVIGKHREQLPSGVASILSELELDINYRKEITPVIKDFKALDCPIGDMLRKTHTDLS